MAKQDGCWPACCDVLIRGAVQHEQLDFVAAALMERARKHEHVPVLAAQAAKVAEDKYNSTQLVRAGCLLHNQPAVQSGLMYKNKRVLVAPRQHDEGHTSR